jgi:hypothetical protein
MISTLHGMIIDSKQVFENAEKPTHRTRDGDSKDTDERE